MVSGYEQRGQHSPAHRRCLEHRRDIRTAVYIPKRVRGAVWLPAFPGYCIKSLLSYRATRRRQGATGRSRDIRPAPKHSPGGTSERFGRLPEDWWSIDFWSIGHSPAMIALQP
jgi:hypothetical protein